MRCTHVSRLTSRIIIHPLQSQGPRETNTLICTHPVHCVSKKKCCCRGPTPIYICICKNRLPLCVCVCYMRASPQKVYNIRISCAIFFFNLSCGFVDKKRPFNSTPNKVFPYTRRSRRKKPHVSWAVPFSFIGFFLYNIHKFAREISGFQ